MPRARIFLASPKSTHAPNRQQSDCLGHLWHSTFLCFFIGYIIALKPKIPSRFSDLGFFYSGSSQQQAEFLLCLILYNSTDAFQSQTFFSSKFRSTNHSLKSWLHISFIAEMVSSSGFVVITDCILHLRGYFRC